DRNGYHGYHGYQAIQNSMVREMTMATTPSGASGASRRAAAIRLKTEFGLHLEFSADLARELALSL
ncbi:MAG TPA: hypothetical protein VMB85_00690, partial [Bryobacteraceae bacterium]|nr:hypothetical protein [Bryobacteraceae bacterium]